MADNSPIEWTDATWNPITGCSIVSPGCTHCYAMKLAGGRLRHHPSRVGLTKASKAGPVWTGEVRFNDKMLLEPLRWTRARKIFVCAHGDLFAEGVPDEWIDKVFAVMALCPQHQFQVLTKRPERMRAYLTETWQPAKAQTYTFGSDVFEMPAEAEGETRRDQVERAANDIAEGNGLIDLDKAEHWTDDGEVKALQFAWPLPNVWLGVSAEDQKWADERIPLLLDTPAAVRFVSLEPLLGPIDLHRWLWINWRCSNCQGFFAGRHQQVCPACNSEGGWCGSHPFNGKHRPARPGFPHQSGSGLDWVIVGGESGGGARPMHPDWARSLRDQCKAAGVAFHFKQHGNWIDADLWLDLIASHGAVVEVDGRAWQPVRPLNFADAEILAAAAGAARRFEHQSDGTTMLHVGKKAAGRLLDGVEHDGFPALQSAGAGQ